MHLIDVNILNLVVKMQRKVDEALHKLSNEARELYLPAKIPILDNPPSPLVFLRDFVGPNRPVIIKNCLENWSALSKWTNEYLRCTLGDTTVTVTSTPNGYADAPVEDKFLLPEEKLMLFKDFLQIWEQNNKDNGVHYIQKQNSNFIDEFSNLVADADSHIQWASEAFGTKPDAVNFWMGNSDSVTSMHKDHYENIYAVVRGCKTFILHPPTDLHQIPYRTYKLAQYKENKEKGRFDIVDIFVEHEEYSEGSSTSTLCSDTTSVENDCSVTDNNYSDAEKLKKDKDTSGLTHKTISWIAVDPLNPDFHMYPEYSKCHKFIATVEAGDMLYLPSLWFHHVTQLDSTIAVNFWYDMQYDIKYNYFKFAEEVSKIVQA